MAEDLGMNIKVAMESQSFQTQIQDINRQMKVVQSEFSNASSKLGDFGNATDGLKVKSSSLGQQLDLQKQIVAKCADQYNKAKENLEKNIKVNEDLKQKVNDTTKAYDNSVSATGKNSEESKKLKAELDQLNQKFKDSQSTINSNVKSVDNYNIKLNGAQTAANKLENEINKTNETLKNHGKALKDTEEKANGAGTGFGGLSGKMAGFGLGAVAIVGVVAGATKGLADMALKSADNAAAMKKLSVSTQLSINDTQEWAYVFNKTGSSTDVMQGAINKLGLTMGKADDESKKATAAFKDLGINIEGTGGKLKPTGTLFEESMTKLAGMKDATERNILAQRLFGGSYTELLPILNKGGAGLEDLKKRAHDLGMVMSDDGVNASAKYKKSMSDLKEQFGAIGTRIANELVPHFASLATFISGKMPLIQSVTKTAFDGISTAVQAVVNVITTAVMPVFNTLWSWIQPNIPAMKVVFTESFALIKQVINDVATAINTNVMPVINALLAWIQPNIPVIKQIFEEAFNFISTVIFPLFNTAIGVITKDVLPALENLFTHITKDILPVFSDYWKWLSDTIIPMLQKIFEQISPPIKEVLNSLGDLFKTIAENIGTSLDKMKGVFDFVFPFIKGLVEGTIKSIGDIIGGLLGIFNGIIEFITGVFSGNWSKALEGIKDIFGGVFDSLVGLAKTPINLIIGLINGLLEHISKIKIDIPHVDIPGLGTVGGGSLGFPNIPNIPYLAQGGIVTRPTQVVVGDNKSGTEAIMPIEKIDSIIASAINKASGGVGKGRDLVIKLIADGKQLAETIVPYSDTMQGNNLVIAGRNVGK